MSTTVELHLSAAYRHAQRSLGHWLEQGSTGLRQRAFAVRAALAQLDVTEQHRLARWLAWLCVAAQSRGEVTPEARIGRLDPALHQSLALSLARLPAGIGRLRAQGHRLSA
jgi:hypothetical protein